MLVLSRRLHEKVVLPTLGITLQVVAIRPGVVRLGIEAPAHIPVLREELLAPCCSVPAGGQEAGAEEQAESLTGLS